MEKSLLEYLKSAVSEVKKDGEVLKGLKENVAEMNNTVTVIARMMFNKQGGQTQRLFRKLNALCSFCQNCSMRSL